ncbi:Cupredoxin [Bombardia bombarda]|uniref:Cupredoxin n=1 Tax=Bombardia bombarda TaxID=252184 RepID=A0AA39XHY9_9PEZI|nr:Cupredoxin [Bombardia bombarda]
MQFSTILVAALASLASAQKTHVVTVALNKTLTFSPNNIKVNPGEMVQFQFAAGNHTITQSTFNEPCQPIAKHSNVTGFHSGFMPVDATAAMVPTYTIMVNNTTPIWAYCAQGKHCEAGMVMVINENTAANASRSLENYKAAAAKATTTIPSGDAGAGGTTGTTTSSGTTLPSSGASDLMSAPRGYMLLAAAAGAAYFL